MTARPSSSLAPVVAWARHTVCSLAREAPTSSSTTSVVLTKARATRHGCVICLSLPSTRKLTCRLTQAADIVVEEIRKAGGKAVANYDSVENGEAIIDTAIKNFGRIDILINNAGILRDISFKNMQDKDWDLINTVHIYGAYKVSSSSFTFQLDADTVVVRTCCMASL